MNNEIKPFSEYPNTFAAISECHAVLTVTHDEDDDFRLYELKQYYALRLNNSAFDWKKHFFETALDYSTKYNLPDPDFDEEEEVAEWKRYNEAGVRAMDYFDAFTKSLSKEDWEVAAAAALSNLDEEVPLRGFNPPTIPGFKISASMLIYSDEAYDILHYGEEEEDDE